MKKVSLFILIPFFLWCSCTEKTYNYYLTVEKGSLAGVVEPTESGARVSAWQGKEVTFTYIDSTGYFILSDLPVGTYTIKVEAEGYTTYESKIYTVYEGGVTTVGTVTLSPFPDLISSVYPQDKAVGVPLYIDLRVYFKKPMNKESVEDAFSIDPATEGTLSWGDYTRPEGRHLEFNPTLNLLPFVLYTVTFDTLAQDTAGNHLSRPFSFSFTTAGVGVDNFYPGNNQVDVPTDIYITIYFNTTMNHQKVEDAFNIEPPTVGNLQWYRSGDKGGGGGRDHLMFRPDPFFKTNTSYTVTLDSTAQDTNGVSIYEPLSFSFTTEKLKVDWTHPGDEWDGISTGEVIIIRFNAAMNRTDTETAFSIIPEIEGSFQWPDPGQLTFDPDQVLASNSLYNITIDSSAQDTEGTKLPQSYHFSFTTREIEISSTSPASGANYVDPHANVEINFNTDMDQLSVVNAFWMIDSDSNEIAGTFFWYGLNKLTFNPESSLTPGEEYTVTVSTDATDLWGINMPEEFVLWFKIRP
jgi:hypothetical protein